MNKQRNGRHRTKKGYIVILKPEHPRADANGFVFEHIIVWEEMIAFRNSGHTVNEVCKKYGICKRTFYNKVNEYTRGSLA